MRVIGIDPGLTGGLGVLSFVGLASQEARLTLVSARGRARATPVSVRRVVEVELHRTPIVEVQRDGRRRREYDVRAMHDLLERLCAEAEPAVEIVIEGQGPRPIRGRRGAQHKGSVSAFHTGLGFGLWVMAAVATGAPYRIVQPAVWKRAFGLIGADKRASRLRAQERFPQLGVIPARGEGPAEGLLLAAYVAGRREQQEGADAGAAAGR